MFSFVSGCGITSEGVKSIGEYLSQEGIVLEELDLSFSITSIQKIIGILFSGWNIIGDEGCVLLAEGLKRNKTVKRLNIKSWPYKIQNVIFYF